MNDSKAGRPPKYSTPEEMQEKIDAYFEKCKGIMLYAEDGNPKLNKYGEPIYVGEKPLTITGLALALGFKSRQALLNYQAKGAFNDTILRAKLMVEEYAERRLFDKDGANGAKFALANNFKGWTEKSKIDAEVNAGVTIINDMPGDD